MTGPHAPTQGSPQLDVHLYWLPPEAYAESDVEGALRTLGYRVRGVDEAVSKRIARETRTGDWSVASSENPWGGEEDFYKPVDSADEITEAADCLTEHFAAFGGEYAEGSGQ